MKESNRYKSFILSLWLIDSNANVFIKKIDPKPVLSLSDITYTSTTQQELLDFIKNILDLKEENLENIGIYHDQTTEGHVFLAKITNPNMFEKLNGELIYFKDLEEILTRKKLITPLKQDTNFIESFIALISEMEKRFEKGFFI